ncbi:MAG: ROK family protein [Phycisphaerae bacterium]|nr:ROK family protein [Phycisphaerae bacterium]
MTSPKQDGLILGWDVGGTTSAVVVASRDGAILAREDWASDTQRGPEAMLADFLVHAKRLCGEHPAIDAAGVSIGGPLNAHTGVILSPPHLPGWDHIPLRSRLESELHLPVVVEHDAAACLLAEVLWGAAEGCSHAAYLTCGTGFGAGLLIHGRIVYGPDGQSPELGHVRLSPDGPMMYGKKGCAESFCSGEGVAKLAHWMFPETFAQPTDTKTLHHLASQGNADAQAVLDESAKRTGQACGILADLFAPRVIVLGSLARYFGEIWVRQVREAMAAEALSINAAHTKVVAPRLGDQLQDLSAVAPCVWAEMEKNP